MRACDLAIASSSAGLQGGLETSRQPRQAEHSAGGRTRGLASRARVMLVSRRHEPVGGLWRAFLVRPRRPTSGDSVDATRARIFSRSREVSARAMKPLMTGEGGHGGAVGRASISPARLPASTTFRVRRRFSGRDGTALRPPSGVSTVLNSPDKREVSKRIRSKHRTDTAARRCSGPPDRPGDAAQAGEKDPQDRAHHRKFHASSLREGARGR